MMKHGNAVRIDASAAVCLPCVDATCRTVEDSGTCAASPKGRTALAERIATLGIAIRDVTPTNLAACSSEAIDDWRLACREAVTIGTDTNVWGWAERTPGYHPCIVQ